MAEIYIKYQNQGFWIQERFIEILSIYICQSFESIGLNTFNPNLIKIYNDCDTNRSGINMGMANILFDKYITNPNDKTILVNVLQQTKNLILSIGVEIRLSILNQFEDNKEIEEAKYNWTIPIQTQSLATTVDYCIALLNQSFPYINKCIHYKGFPVIDGAITV